jgi:hypothetical protein
LTHACTAFDVLRPGHAEHDERLGLREHVLIHDGRPLRDERHAEPADPAAAHEVLGGA